MKVDILLCVDGTSSMEKVIEDVKANISLFVNNLIQGLRLNSDNDIERIRIKFVVFRNADYDKNDWYPVFFLFFVYFFDWAKAQSHFFCYKKLEIPAYAGMTCLLLLERITSCLDLTMVEK